MFSSSTSRPVGGANDHWWELKPGGVACRGRCCDVYLVKDVKKKTCENDVKSSAIESENKCDWFGWKKSIGRRRTAKHWTFIYLKKKQFPSSPF